MQERCIYYTCSRCIKLSIHYRYRQYVHLLHATYDTPHTAYDIEWTVSIHVNRDQRPTKQSHSMINISFVYTIEFSLFRFIDYFSHWNIEANIFSVIFIRQSLSSIIYSRIHRSLISYGLMDSLELIAIGRRCCRLRSDLKIYSIYYI